MHGGPSGDLYTMLSFRQCKDQFTLVFYDHRCNGRSTRVPVTSMTWENLTADADALRERLGFEKWAVLGHSFGGNVALEYALRYPDRLSHLVLLNTGAEGRWSLENASTVLAERGYSPDIVNLAKRWLNGEIPPKESFRTLMKLGKAYNPHSGMGLLARMALEGAARGAHLRGASSAARLVGHRPPWRDTSADAGDGGQGRLHLPARAPGRACRAHTELAPKAHRARRSQSARRADR